MRISILIISLTLFLFSCGQANKEKTGQEPSASVADSLSKETLPPLPEGEVSLTDADFGEIIELRGTQHPVDQIFKVSEFEMMVSDSILITCTHDHRDADMFMAFSLPDFKFLKSFGRFGRGPGDFQSPTLVKDESGEFLCLIYEQISNHLYALNRNFEIKELPIKLRSSERSYHDKQFYGISSREFLYVESTKSGKAMFRINSEDTIITPLKDLAFSAKHTNWAAYIGDFGANVKKRRAVFAYKYFKRLVFLDLKNNTSKTVSFDLPTKTKRGDAVSMLAPSTVTHYWGMSSQDKYVYVLYSGRTPTDVFNELKHTSGYIYVEKFDWNGNPISKYKLDHWGYFCVDEKHNTFYLASTTDDQPFFSYNFIPGDK